MAISDTITAIRKELGITQEEMARRLYVTRQAVSRWENGETTPGIDMVKLICVTFGVPLERFFDMPENYFCQCCGMPIPESDLHGCEADGSKSAEYCKYCYAGGDFTAKGVSMEEFIEATAPFEAEAMGITLDETVSLMATLLPHLKRWRDVERNEAAYGDEIRAAYGDEVVDAANKKYVSMGDAAHLRADELALAINEQLRRAMETGDASGLEAQKLVAMHAHWLRLYWPDGLYSPEAHKGLADGYVADDRFRAHYEAVAPGAAHFLRDAIHACADACFRTEA